SADGGVPPGRARPRAFPLPGPVVDKSGSRGGRPEKSGRPLLPQEHAADPKERLNFMPAPTPFILLAAGACLFGSLVLFTSADHEPKPKPVTFEDYPFIEPKGYVCYRAASPLVIDGKLNDEAWKAAPWSDAFVDIEGDQKSRPRHRTRVKMLWDDR